MKDEPLGKLGVAMRKWWVARIIVAIAAMVLYFLAK